MIGAVKTTHLATDRMATVWQGKRFMEQSIPYFSSRKKAASDRLDSGVPYHSLEWSNGPDSFRFNAKAALCHQLHINILKL